jgi:hypothetical protein
MPGGNSNRGDSVDFFCKQPVDIVRDILKAVEELGQFRDGDTILDRGLLEARKISAADAGSIFLIRDGQLHFSYVHNDTLFRQSEASRHIYTNLTVPVSEASIVGYAALTGQTLVIEDAYRLDPALPYSFNQSFDEESGYRTRSILAIPLTTLRGTRVGVMQLINATEDGRGVPFSDLAVQYAPFFANHASVAIERGIMTRELILRMMKMAEMRDPSETGAHVQRVGAYAAEIYQHMAVTRGEDGLEIKRKKDLIRLAAMLRDGVTPEQCGESFVTACAILALAMIRQLETDGVRSFTAGKLSVTMSARADTAVSQLERLAMGLIAGYTTDAGFVFRGVKS